MAMYGDVTHDSRVQREAMALAAAGYRVALVCLAGQIRAADRHPGVELIVRQPSITSTLPGSAAEGRRGLARIPGMAGVAWVVAYLRNLRAWGRMAVSAVGKVDAWHLHDLPGLAAISLARRDSAPVVYDAHEIFLESGAGRRLPGPLRWLARRYEARLVERAAALVTVNDSLAEVFRTRYRPRRVTVLHNCPDRWDPPTEPVDHLRAATGLARETPILLYLGSVGPGRGLEQLCLALLEPGVGSAHLVVLGPSRYTARYQALAADTRWNGRVHLLEPVDPADVPAWAHTADVGTCLIQPTTLNHRLSTPNKLFECIAAGVPVVASDFGSIAGIVLPDAEPPLGVLCDPTDPEAIGRAIARLLDASPQERDALRARCLDAAQRRWNWAVESQRLTDLYAHLDLST
jgi:glycosyltransferase involved in cell wall biosynthesis